MRILLIAGHGAADPGAVATHGGKVYREATETRAVVAGLVEALLDYAEVTVYDTERNAYADYRAGTLRTLAQFSKYDYVLEVHFNAIEADQGDGKTKGTECYVTTTEPGVKVETGIVSKLAALGFASRGVFRKDYSVIHTARQAGTSAALLEVCFIDDADDMKLYLAKKAQVVQAIAEGIVEGFGLSKAATEKEEPDMIIYKTLADVPAWARPTVDKLIGKGLLEGNGRELNLEYNSLRVLVINDRAGLYE